MDIPTMIGSTVDEGMLFVEMAFPREINNLQYRAIIKAVMKDQSRTVMTRYPPMVSTKSNLTLQHYKIPQFYNFSVIRYHYHWDVITDM